MPRTTKGNLAAKKHKAVLARTKGHYGARSRLFKTAKQSYSMAKCQFLPAHDSNP